jgi:hypothetical protein
MVIPGRACAARDRAINSIASHISGERLIDCSAQTWIICYVATACFCRNSKLTNYFRKNLTALRILPCFSVLDVGPFTMTCHNSLTPDLMILL